MLKTFMILQVFVNHESLNSWNRRWKATLKVW